MEEFDQYTVEISTSNPNDRKIQIKSSKRRKRSKMDNSNTNNVSKINVKSWAKQSNSDVEDSDQFTNMGYSDFVDVEVGASHTMTKKRGRPRKGQHLTCGVCVFQAETVSDLEAHVAAYHQNVRQHACPECHALFTQKGNLVMHMKTHDPERPYACTVCPFTAVQKNNFIVHQRTHTNEKPFECSECDYKAAQMGNLRGHFLRKHSTQNPAGPNRYRKDTYAIGPEGMFQCPHCSFECKKMSLMTRHIDVYHEEDPLADPEPPKKKRGGRPNTAVQKEEIVYEAGEVVEEEIAYKEEFVQEEIACKTEEVLVHGSDSDSQ